MKRIIYTALAITTCLSFNSPAFACGKTPEDLAEHFCKAVAQHNKNGDEKGYEELLTKALLSVVKEAQDTNDAIAKEFPDEKPPLGDGVPYAAFPDSPPECKGGKVTDAEPGHKFIEIAYHFPKEPKADWTDKLELRHTDDGWRIDDVLFARDYKSGLRSVITPLAK